MTKLNSPIVLSTAFGEYTLREILGEGGAGRVYGGIAEGGESVAVKVLTKSSTDKRRRFKNEIAFLARNNHPNLVPVIDHGVAVGDKADGPFYVMPRYQESLRQLIARGIPAPSIMPIFSQILDGVEAAHLLGVTHRDLKPENILVSNQGKQAAIADFGVATFSSDNAATFVETAPGQRLANFQYAAPEQRTQGQQVSHATDIYALGLILNEMFTGTVPHGTSFKQISASSPDHAYLDPLIDLMTKQSPNERPASILNVKTAIQKYHAEAVSIQRLSQLKNTVIPAGEIDEPLAHEPPQLAGARWDNGALTLTLDRPVNNDWATILNHHLGNFSYTLGNGPDSFRISGSTAVTRVDEGSAQSVVDNFKSWLPTATRVYKQKLQEAAERDHRERTQRLQQERVAEEKRLRINSALRI